MTLLIPSLLGAFCYLIAGGLQAASLSGKRPEKRPLVMGLGAVALLLHTFAVYHVLHTDDGIQLALFPVSSLIAWLVAGLVLASSLRKPLTNLFVAIFPLAAITLLLAMWVPPSAPAHQLEPGIIGHILTSILAYSIFTIAAVQAFLLAAQEHQLKHHHTRGIVKALPPLQLMEQLLFEMVWTGIILLTVSLISGFLFLDDIFAQHLVHKTVLSLVAWLLFACLLWGRHQWGWRGRVAIRWTLGGFLFLMLAYFGSKVVLELLLPLD
ncbi:cytochrome C assembly family protein [Motiliproteus sediminis]|uniref:cytochrome C assembly family protein n=1 Tax=Motiliproteus sediminis TaxID=1468178 RepID=UPI001AEFD6A2|nr:cytochrome c biogenesis protein CcsA [Motiliproteus sediminis]